MKSRSNNHGAVPSPGAPDAAKLRQLDLRGLRCPLPVLKIRKALRSMAPGELMSVLCDDPMAAIDVPNHLREDGDDLVSAERDGSILRFVIRRATDP